MNSVDEYESRPIPETLRNIWIANGLPERFISNLKLQGNADTAIPSTFCLGLAAQISIALAGLSTAYIHYLRTGVEEEVKVDARHAVLSFHSEAWYTIDGAVPPGNPWDNFTGLYQTKDGGWVRIHTNFPHHREGILSILNVPDSPVCATKIQVADAIKKWDAQAFEDKCAKHGMCAVKMRSFEEWKNSPQGKVLEEIEEPVVQVREVGKAKRREDLMTGNVDSPLDGLRMLDLTRVLAGPVAGKTLAVHGAQVLWVTSPKLPSSPLIDMETSLGKRTTQLHLTWSASEEIGDLKELVRDADIFLQAYRPGGLEEKGFGVDDVVNLKAEDNDEGIIYASLRAWGWDGPWAGRRGFDSIIQTATGFNEDEGNEYQAFKASLGERTEWRPKVFPMQAIDHAAGYFLAFGINVALARMMTVGGSHEVRVSLAGVGRWIRSLGRIETAIAFGPYAREIPPRKWPLEDEIAALSTEWRERPKSTGESGRRMTALKQAAVLSVTPAKEGVLSAFGAPMRLDADKPVWIDECGDKQGTYLDTINT